MGILRADTSPAVSPPPRYVTSWERAGVRIASGHSGLTQTSLNQLRGRYATELVTAPQGPRQRPATYWQSRFRPPPGATELELVRHGQSEAYLDGTLFPLVGGHGDPQLSTEGREQAERVCARLSADGIDAIYVTTLCRTVQTAAPLAERLGLAVTVEAGLREVYLGEWEGGRYRQMVADGHPTAQQVFAEERWELIPGAEPSAAFAERVQAAIERLAAKHPGERVAAFTHGGVIGQALALASGSRPFAFLMSDNTAIARLVLTPEKWILRGFNDVGHLQP